jgi:shikimate kinase/3-dehydroquinate synthase
MGAGKSSAVRAVQRSGAAEARDLDAAIEAREQKRVLDLFHADEARFREIEREVALELLEKADGEVVAFGGGTPMDHDVQVALADHTVAYLQVKPAKAWERVSRSDRPLVQRGEENFNNLHADRAATYEGLAQVIMSPGKPDAIVGALPWIRALRERPPGTRMLLASSASGSYPIIVGRGILESDWWPIEGRSFYVCDQNSQRHYSDPLRQVAGPIVLEPGEESKNMVQVTKILEEFAERELARHDYVVALGGGVVGDMTGFCAHIYQRGVPVVQVPTTLVAQVDSAYGGKTGVDLPQGKNYAGAYHLPAAVIADVDALTTLPDDQLAAGFVEVLKTGLLAGDELWERVRTIDKIVPAELDDVVFECARFKCGVVGEDEQDTGRRHILNFGHTVGHAIEAATEYARYGHGEAVGLGLLAALRLSEADRLRAEIREILVRHGLPVELDPPGDPAELVDAILLAVGRDKKRTLDGVGFVLLSEPGKPRERELVDPAMVRGAVEELLP